MAYSIPEAEAVVRPRKTTSREVAEADLDVLRADTGWRLVRLDVRPWPFAVAIPIQPAFDGHWSRPPAS